MGGTLELCRGESGSPKNATRFLGCPALPRPSRATQCIALTISSLCLLSPGRHEGEDFFRKFARLLDVREMARPLDAFETRAGDGLAVGFAIVLAQHAVVHSPENQRRDANAMQPAPELGVMHVGRPGVTRGRFAVACGMADRRVRHGLVIALARIGVA